jgi:hypothetical protein
MWQLRLILGAYHFFEGVNKRVYCQCRHRNGNPGGSWKKKERTDPLASIDRKFGKFRSAISYQKVISPLKIERDRWKILGQDENILNLLLDLDKMVCWWALATKTALGIRKKVLTLCDSHELNVNRAFRSPDLLGKTRNSCRRTQLLGKLIENTRITLETLIVRMGVGGNWLRMCPMVAFGICDVDHMGSTKRLTYLVNYFNWGTMEGKDIILTEQM